MSMGPSPSSTVSFKESSTVETEPTVAPPLSPDFCADDADVVIRAAGTLDFRVHKFILSLVSPVFKDMFTLPQPPSDTPETLPHVDVQESAKTWENILRTIYPTVPNPTIDTLDDLQSLLSAAQVYEMQLVIETHKKAFENRAFIEGNPLHLFSIACACGFEDQATYVARNAELLGVTRRFSSSSLKGLTFDAYGRLVSFLAERDDEWRRVLRSAWIPYYLRCSDCNEQSRVSLCDSIKEDLCRPYLRTEEVYIKALGYWPAQCTSGCSSCLGTSGHLGIKDFIERMTKEREKVYDKFQPAKWFVKGG